MFAWFALKAKIVPVLLINKVDKAILNLKLNESELKVRLKTLITNVNYLFKKLSKTETNYFSYEKGNVILVNSTANSNFNPLSINPGAII